jgi:predicted transcriptional regulator
MPLLLLDRAAVVALAIADLSLNAKAESHNRDKFDIIASILDIANGNEIKQAFSILLDSALSNLQWLSYLNFR